MNVKFFNYLFFDDVSCKIDTNILYLINCSESFIFLAH